MGQDLLLVLGVIIVTFVVLRLGWRRRREAIAAQGAPGSAGTRAAGWQFGPPSEAPAPDPIIPTLRSTPGSAPASAAPAQEMNDVLLQLQTVSREVEARLDTRIRYTKRLMQDAEGICQRLQGLLDAAQRMRPGTSDLPERTRRRPVDAPANPFPAPRSRPAPNVSAETFPAVPLADMPLADMPLADVPHPEVSPAEPRPNVDRDEVGRLAAQGLNPVEIANRVDRPVGEIELMLALNRHAPPPEASPPGTPE